MKRRPSRLEAALAGVRLLAAAASFGAVYALCGAIGASSQAAIVAAILAIGLSRRPLTFHGLPALAIPFVLSGVAVVAAGVGRLLRDVPFAGAVVFVVGMFLSVWLRNFGALARRAGALLGLPLVALLVIPPPSTSSRGGPAAEFAMVVCAGLIAFAFVAAAQWAAGRIGLASPAPPERVERKREPRPGAGMSVQTRMALQMAVALSLSFAIGFALFPGHWGWAVLTAYIVCSGARGRGDAAYKGVLRRCGALTGTLAAALTAHLWLPTGAPEAIAIFAVLYFGLWLRDVNYAYWACAMTLVLAMLAGGGGSDLAVLGVRLEAILAGALCAVAATWFVFPIRTRDVIRRRLADALAALDEFIAHAHPADQEPATKLALFEHHLGQLDQVAPPLRWHRSLVRDHPEHPARWIEMLAGVRDHVRAYAAREKPTENRRTTIRKAIGASRRAIANGGRGGVVGDGPSIGASLADLRDSLAEAHAPAEAGSTPE